MKKVLYKISCDTVGDSICATPTLRKLSTLYNDKIIVINRYEEIFKNNPYVDYVIHPDKFDVKQLRNNQEFFESCVLKGKQNQFGIERHFNTFDIRQIHCNDLGFYLMPEELTCDFVPESDTEKILFTIPKEFVVIHASTNWPNRTWAIDNWKEVIQYLADKKIFTVLIGKDMEEFLHPSIGNKVEKKFSRFDNLFGIDLTNKTTLSESWHLLNRCKYVITIDTGVLHLAGTTDTFIIQLGSAKDPRRVAPYRLGSQNYKYKHIKGPCDLYCTNNLKYAIREWKTVNAVPPLIGCLENKSTFECHPTPRQVIDFLETL
jgi:ADP-heptose:LPS heptosyltransferase